MPTIKTDKKKIVELRLSYVIAAVSVFFVLMAYLMAKNFDKSMREELLIRGKLASKVINSGQIDLLKGSIEDMSNPEFLHLQYRLSAIRQAVGYRYVYIMGCRTPVNQQAEKEIFFYVDVQDDDVEEDPASAPGDLYEDASDELKAAFDNGEPFVEGPLEDKWGVWVSAIVPIVDGTTGEVKAILGLDIDARDWYLDIAISVARQLAMIAVFFIATTTVMFVLYRSGKKIREQKELLKDSREHLAATLRSIGDGVISTDAQGRVTNLNIVAETLTGWKIDEAIGQKIEDVLNIVSAYTRELTPNPIYKSIEDGIIVELANHTLLLSKDGKEYHIADSCAPIRDSEGNITGAVLVFRDVSVNKRAIDLLKESESQFKTLFTDSPIAIFIHDKDTGEIINANPAACKMYGYENLQDLRENDFWLKPPFSFEDALVLIRKAATGGKQTFQWLACNKDGQEFWEQVTLCLITLAGVERVMAVVIDITDRKKAIEDLEKSREQFELAVKGSNDGIWDWDLRNGELYLSPRWKEQLGYTESELGNSYETFEQLLHQDDKKTVEQYLKKYLNGDMEQFNIEFRLRHKTGKWVWILSRAIAVRDDKGFPIRMAGSHTDITEAKLVQEQILLSRKQAQEASKAKSEFVANMSHEIRTPLNGVIGMTELLLEMDLTDKQREYIEVMRSSGQLLLGIINDILDFSKIEANKIELEDIRFNLSDFVKDFNAAMSLIASQKDIKLYCNIEPDVPTMLRGDYARLSQILNNLVGNAIKFTKEGEVALKISVVEDNPNDALIKFAITDTGIGIATDKIGQLFQKFTQADTSINRSHGGTGLGLAISKSLTELMGGQIGVRSEPGVGSVFWFTARFNKSRAKQSLSSEQNSGKSRREQLKGLDARILLVEDNIFNQKVAVGMLESIGMNVDTALNGKEAIKALNCKTYDLVFMDVQMPVMNGYEATKKIRGGEVEILNPDVVIVAMTANASQADRADCIAIGMNDYLSKPFTINSLVDTLSKWLLKSD